MNVSCSRIRRVCVPDSPCDLHLLILLYEHSVAIIIYEVAIINNVYVRVLRVEIIPYSLNITHDQVFSQANASLKSHAGAESQGVPQSYSCIYEAPSEDKDVEGSSETSDSTRLAEPGRSTTTAAPAVDLELLDQEVNGNVKINVRFEYTAPFISS